MAKEERQYNKGSRDWSEALFIFLSFTFWARHAACEILVP